MARPLLLIASRHSAMAKALHQYIALLFPNDELPHRVEHLGFSSAAELFEALDGYTPEQLRETMVIFDLVPEDGSSWEVTNMRFERGLAAQLVLSYPEIYFVFLSHDDPAQAFPILAESDGTHTSLARLIWGHHFVRADRPHQLVKLIQYHARGFGVIFDATGLRSLVKQRLLNEVGGIESKIYEPLLKSRLENHAAIVDEESAFVYLNGYVAYQAGFCSWLLGTWSEFRRLLMRDLAPTDNSGDKSMQPATSVKGPSAFNVVLSDWDLAFPDLPGGSNNAELLLQEDLFKSDERLILITSFNAESQEVLVSKQNGFREVKPYGGMFKLFASTPISGENPLKDQYDRAWAGILTETASVGTLAKVRGIIDKLLSNTRPPLARVARATGSTEPGAQKPTIRKLSHHSAPHARSVVANRLLARSKRLTEHEELSTTDAIHMALLAGEAKEILGGMSRTTAYQALSTQNEAEVSAEVSFMGMSARVEVTDRLTKLKQEARVVQNIQALGNAASTGNSLALREGEEAHLNFLLQAVKKLRLRFTEHEQMEASEECLCTFAEYHYRLTPWRLNPLQFLRKMFEGYLIKATKSGTSVLQLLVYCFYWIVAFGLVYFALLLFHVEFMKQVGGSDAAAVASETNDTAPPSGNFSEDSGQAPDANESTLLDYPLERWLADLKRPWNCLAVGMWHSLFTFLELQPGLPDIEQLRMEQPLEQSYQSMGWMLIYRAVVLMELIVAYFHLGLLVSVLYRHLTRRSP